MSHLKLFLEHGKDSLKRLLEFLLVSYDLRSNTLYLIRDQVGVKPLYYIIILKIINLHILHL